MNSTACLENDVSSKHADLFMNSARVQPARGNGKCLFKIEERFGQGKVVAAQLCNIMFHLS